IPIMLMLLFSLTFWVTEEARASAPSNVTFTFPSEQPQVDVSPGSLGNVTLNGSVNCTIKGTDQVEVYLLARSDIGSASVIPPKRVLSGLVGTNITVDYTVTTRVPLGYKNNPQVSVFGYFVQNGLYYEIPSASQTIGIKPFYKLEVNTPPPKEIEPGADVFFSIQITNKGNDKDTFEFSLFGDPPPCEKQWAWNTLTPKTLLPDESITIIFSAQAPRTWALWRNEVQPFNIRIRSQQSMEEGGNVRCDISLYVRQKGSYIPGFNPNFVIFGIIFVAIVMGKKGYKHKKGPDRKSEHPKGLYHKLPMSMR
ncbi:MAG: hypothetical protein JSV56_02335, partial [Methanomassiliicoccales archaeon]